MGEGETRDERELGKGQFLLLFHEYFPVGLRDMGTNQVGQGLQAVAGTALNCQRDEQVHHMFCCVFVDNKLSVEHLNRMS